MEKPIKDPRDKHILFYFIAFFLLIIVVNSVFAYLAVTTRTGLVVDNPYERGLDYNQTLRKATLQPELNQNVQYNDGVLLWTLANKDNIPLDNATVTARIIRQVHDGYDFDITLEHRGGGIYETVLDLPMKGAWLAKLSSKWNNNQYQTTHEFIAK